ncbi:hypothetical protein ABPG75_010652 [Micractinium tetrahymenae]
MLQDAVQPPPSASPGTQQGLPEVALEAHYAYRRLLATVRCLPSAPTTNCSNPANIKTYESQHLDPQSHLVLLAECGLLPNCTAWQDSQPDAAGSISAALKAGAARLAAWLAAVEGTGARLCPLPDAGGLFATAAVYPDMDKPVMGLPDWPYALVVQGNLTAGGLRAVAMADDVNWLFGTSYGLDRIEELAQLLIHQSLPDAVLARKKVEASTAAAGRRRFLLQESLLVAGPTPEAGAAPAAENATASPANTTCHPIQAQADELAAATPAACQQLPSPATAAMEGTVLTFAGDPYSFVGGQAAVFENISRTFDFTLSGSDAGLAAYTAPLAAAVAWMVRITAPPQPGATTPTLNLAGIAGVVCGAATAGKSLLEAAALQCAAPEACNATAGACATAAKGDLTGWGVWVNASANGRPQSALLNGTELLSTATGPASAAAGLAPPPAAEGGTAEPTNCTADGPFLPDEVLGGHYAFRTFLSLSRCLVGAGPGHNCSNPDSLPLFNAQHLYWESHLVPLDSNGTLTAQCGSAKGVWDAFGWTAANLSAALADMTPVTAQTLLEVCDLLDNCTAWRDGQADPGAAISAALQCGAQRMLRWCRACPDIVQLGGLHNWPAALLIAGNITQSYDLGLLLKGDALKWVFSTDYGLDRIEELQQLLIHFSLSDSLLSELRLQLPYTSIGRERRLRESFTAGRGVKLAYNLMMSFLGILTSAKDAEGQQAISLNPYLAAALSSIREALAVVAIVGSVAALTAAVAESAAALSIVVAAAVLALDAIALVCSTFGFLGVLERLMAIWCGPYCDAGICKLAAAGCFGGWGLFPLPAPMGNFPMQPGLLA